MDLELTSEQQMLQEAARSFVDRKAPSDQVVEWFRGTRALPAELHQTAAASGWLGMPIPVELGGGGAELRDCAVVFEQLGRGPVPGPVFSSGVLAPLLLLEAGSEEQQGRLIPPLCSGEATCAVALSDDVHWDMTAFGVSAEADGDAYVLDGRKHFVHEVQRAGWMLCAALGQEGTLLVLVDLDSDGVEVVPHSGFLTSLADVELRSVRVPRENVFTGGDGAESAVEAALLRAVPILAAYQVGGCQRVFEMTLAYTSERVVFGQAIGRFQRVQDHCVELVNHLDAARWITYETLWKLDSGLPALAAAHEAKAVASEAYYHACNEAHKVFAGHGTALDHPLVPHTLMSRTLYQYLGEPRYHKDRMMSAIVQEMSP